MRRPLRRAAWLNIAGNPQPIRCVLWDISSGGARLAAARIEELPDKLTLILAKDGTVRRPCEIVWRDDRFVGVKFV